MLCKNKEKITELLIPDNQDSEIKIFKPDTKAGMLAHTRHRIKNKKLILISGY